LTVLIHRALQVGLTAADPDVGLIQIQRSPVACRAGRAESMNSAVKVCTQR
jgi:hypothetical protein